MNINSVPWTSHGNSLLYMQTPESFPFPCAASAVSSLPVTPQRCQLSHFPRPFLALLAEVNTVTMLCAHLKLFSVDLALYTLHVWYIVVLHSLPSTYDILSLPTHRCTGHAEWKIRVLVSRAVVPMLSSANVATTLLHIVRQLSLQHQNQLHGHLLILHQTVRDHSQLLQCSLEGGQPLAHLLLHQLLEKSFIASE